ncbi:MAG: FIST N-terminal domain-containing protein [Candidatus Electryonea clarkiae]|nr:FIST N-terminal domain-containing protein [Candidatus Electryonea clarkiae]MDP8287915.1 FIST N-terminal domain-containing protein [Candidatus Electryonea clarkiae]
MQVGIGHSEMVDSIDAIQEAINQCKEAIGDSRPHAALLFSAICYDYSTLLDEVHKAFPGVQLIGCTTDGELSSLNSFLEDSLVLICMSSENIQFSSGSGTNVSADPHTAIQNALDDARRGLTTEPQLCITYYDSLTTSGTVVLNSLNVQLGENITVFGGVAGDQWQLKSTNQFHNQDVLNDAVTVLLVGGGVKFSTGVATGHQPFGKTFKITKVESNVVFEIDNQTAVEFYEKYVGHYDRAPGEYPLAVRIDNSKDFYLRAPLVFNDNGSIAFAGDIPLGAQVQLTQSTSDAIIQAAETSVNSALRDFPGDKIDLALVSSCAARRIMLGTRVQEEVDLLQSILPVGTGIGGFYAYGEICPVQKSSQSKFHNETFVTILLGEK